ncbi:MAG: hypothetical protein PHY77_03625, partial [Desulfotomaculaceae bacterium]|nr:hypothetical protein [Desulfotomaculaceae bacterium]
VSQQRERLPPRSSGRSWKRPGSEVHDSLIKQVYSPVRWEECVLKMISLGVDTFIEVGPGKVLSGLIKKIRRDATILNIEDRSSLEKTLALTREVS